MLGRTPIVDRVMLIKRGIYECTLPADAEVELANAALRAIAGPRVHIASGCARSWGKHPCIYRLGRHGELRQGFTVACGEAAHQEKGQCWELTA